MKIILRLVVLTLAVLALYALARVLLARVAESRKPAGSHPGTLAAAVEVAPVEHGEIVRRRTFSGSLEARSEFVVAPKVAGRVLRLAVDLADTVERAQIVAELDSDEYRHAVARARAELALARARVVEARAGLDVADRELKRVRRLGERGIATGSELETAEATRLAKSAALDMVHAQVTSAEAELAITETRLGYTRVAADWTDGDAERTVAERFVDAGDTVQAGSPLFSIIELDPVTAVVFVTEGDYTRLSPGQAVELTTDAHPGRRFAGKVARIAPVFRASSRQARIELTVPNPEKDLKPGMFVRAEVVLDRVGDATIVPAAAIAVRAGESGVFVVEGDVVRWRPVTVGIRDGDRLQVVGEGVAGSVVTLGQQLVEDGSPVSLGADGAPADPSAP